MLIIRRLNCIDAASGIVTLSKGLSGANAQDRSLTSCAERAVMSHFLRICVMKET